ncbi:hypothetical protein QFC21_005309 [Naganishia friedmannii]|uniref:Uncharacterized protein n=1 Tax=Naganishia friedmannii TaxID=89922 RepID=A0ACC2V9I5_9TREE|nr:hypothetical protein QFC21_005309 [Naganishia friedmannii]
MACTPQNISCNYDPGSTNYFTGKVEETAYNYLLNQSACIALVVVFGLSAALHLGQAIWSRQSWLIWTLTAGAVGECIGWSGRLWSSVAEHWDPSNGGFYDLDRNGTSFLMQISTLIISPAFMAAGNYILLGRIIPILGSKYSFVHPLSYTIIFVVGDLISLAIQAIGGGQASAADNLEDANKGAKVMVGGVMFQMAVMIAYSIVLVLFVYRYKTDRPLRSRQIQLFSWWPNALRTRRFKKSSPPMIMNRKEKRGSVVTAGSPYTTTFEDEEGMGAPARVDSEQTDQRALVAEKQGREIGKTGVAPVVSTRTGGFGDNGESIVYSPRELRGAEIMLWACALSTLLIFIRSVYRSVELLNGWEGPIIRRQTLFNLLDGMLMLYIQ